MRQTNVRGSLSLRGFRKLRTGAIVATGVILLGLGFLAPTVSASEQDGVWVARTVEEVKADLQKEGDLFKYVIKWGDTLSVISEASNIPVDVLQEMNQASGKNLFLPHNELYFTEAETVSDTVTKHKIVIKESGASGEVRTYEVLLKEDQETKAVTFELTDVTEKVEKMAVNYSPVYQPVSAPVVERAEESGEKPASEAPAVTSPEVNAETEAPVAPKAEDAATTPAPKETAPEVVTPAESTESKVTEPEAAKPVVPKAETPTPKVEESAESAEPKTEAPTTPENKEEQPGATEAPEPEVTEPAAESTVTEGTTPEVTTTGDEEKDSKVEEADSKEEVNSTEGRVDSPSTPKAEEMEESSNNPSTGATTSTDSGESTTVTDATPSNDETTEQPGTSAPKTEATAPKTDEPAVPAPKNDESGSSVESPSTGNHSDESGAPSTTPTGDSTAPKPSDSTSSPVASGESNSTEQPAGETGKSETTPESSNTPSADATNESGNAAESSPVADDTTSNGETIDQPVAPSSNSDDLAPKAAETGASGETGTTAQPVGEAGESEKAPSGEAEESTEPKDSVETAPKESTTEGKESAEAGTTATPTESTSPADSNNHNNSNEPKDDVEKGLEENTEALESRKNIKLEEINSSSLSSSEKEAAKLKVEEYTTKAKEAMKQAKTTDDQASIVDQYDEELANIATPGVDQGKPDYTNSGLSNNGPEGTNIGDGNAIGHGSGEAPSAATQPAPAEGTDISSVTTSSTQPATGTNSDSTGTAQPQPAVTSPASSAQPTNESSASTGAATESPAPTSDSSTPDNSGFRSAGTYQPRVTRRERSVDEPQNKVSIYYNYDGMKDIPGFFNDLDSKNEVEVPQKAPAEALKSILKSKIDQKKAELEKKGYKISDEYFVGIDQADATHYDYVVTFTKETTGTTGFRIAPKVQVRAKKVVKRDLSNKTKHINVYYNLTSLKDIAGSLGELGGENVLTFSGETSKEELKRAVEEKTKAQIEKLKKQGFTVTSKTDLDQIIEGGDSYDYVVEFTKEAKTQPVGTTGFRNAPLVQRRAKRSTEAKETVNVNIYFNLKTLPGIAGALDVDGETTIKLPKNASEEEVKEAIKAKIAKVENRGYKVNDFYFGAKTEKGYDYVVEFTK